MKNKRVVLTFITIIAIIYINIFPLAKEVYAADLLIADFDSDAGGFSYSDDTFMGTSQPSYATGSRVTGSNCYGGSGGCLYVGLGGVDEDDINDMSAGWLYTLSLASPQNGVSISLRYRFSMDSLYDYDEYSRILVNLDGIFYGRGSKNYVDHIGGDNTFAHDTGWLQTTLHLGDLDAGNHTLVIGGFNNKKTTTNELTNIYLDDVMLTSGNPVPVLTDTELLIDRLDINLFKSNIQVLSDFGDRCREYPDCAPYTSYFNAQNWVRDQLESWGYETFTHTYVDGNYEGVNLYATKVGSVHPDQMYIVAGHLDGRSDYGTQTGEGGAADDNGSTIALLLELARVLSSPDVQTDVSVRFIFWDQEEWGLYGSKNYVSDRRALQGLEDPTGSGKYPEPTWLGNITHDMILYDHGVGSVTSQQSPYADLDVEWRRGTTFEEQSKELAQTWRYLSGEYAPDYPANSADYSTNTDDTSFHNYCPSISVRENRRSLSEEWINPFYHRDGDNYDNYNEDDFLLGFNAVQTTFGVIADLSGAHILGDNDPPVADSQSLVTNEDTTLGITLTGSDPNDDPLSFVVSSAPGQGILSGSAPNLIYTPDDDYNGTDSFQFRAYDGRVYSDPATVSITINPMPDMPVAEEQSLTTGYNTPTAITLTGYDGDGDQLTFGRTSYPSHGVLSGTEPNLVYSPDAGYFGGDSFTFIVNDGTQDSQPATVIITVNPPGPVTVFFDDFESDLGWDEDPYGNDDATTGMWARAIPEEVYYNNGYMQLDETYSGSYDLVTGPLYGSSAGTHDIDNGETSILSPEISLPAGSELTLSFYYYFAHASNGSSDDYLRVSVVGDSTQLVFEELGSGEYDFAAWENFSIDISAFAGQTVRLLIAAADAGSGSLIEAGVDDVMIEGVQANNPPIADPQSVSLEEDTSLGITLSGSDFDGDPLTFVVETNPSHGSLSGTSPDFIYIPNADFNGTDSFTFYANDGMDVSAPATVSIAVSAVNDPPVADPQSVATDENISKAITLTGSDVDGDSLSFAVTSAPAHGNLSGTAPDLTYTPDAGYEGTDSFSFTVSDGEAVSSPAVVSILVNEVNDAPTADDQAVSTDEDTALGITLTGSDPEGQALDFTILTAPSHGSLSGAAPDLTYTPDANFNGSDSFTFKVNDGELDSEAATVGISVNAVNDVPTADSQSVTTDEDTPLGVTLSGSDVEGSSLIFTVETQPANGILSGTVPDLTYTPDADFNGVDSFTFKVNDGELDSVAVMVEITVQSVNDVPVADSQSVTTNEDTALGISLTGSDVEDSALTFTVANSPDHGTLSGTAPDVTYTPDADFNGTDSFSFTVNDGEAESDPATVSITIAAVNDAPLAEAQSVSVDEDASISITLTGSDDEGSTLSFMVETQPANGVLSGTAPDLTYTPDANFNGLDSFTFKVNDGALDSDAATVEITINAVNDVPTADSQLVTTDEDTALGITLTGSDVEGSALSFAVTSGPDHGTLSGTAPNLIYTPDDDFNGTDGFSFAVNDGEDDSDPATVTINVNAINDAPLADPQTVATQQDVPVLVTLTGSDVDGDGLSFAITSAPAHGNLSGTAPDLTYTPDAGYEGTDSFSFTVSDGEAESSPAAVSILVNEVNDAPTADDQAVIAYEDTALGIKLTGSDPEGQALDFTILTPPSHGSLSGTVPNLTYTPDTDFNGSDSFTFKVNDGELDSEAATVTITVNAVNDIPTANSQSVSTDEDTTLGITLTGSDVEGSGLTFTVITDPVHGVLSGTAPDLTYTPDANFNGTDSFTFKVNDGALDSDAAMVEITVQSVNDIPTADSQSVTTDEDTALGITLTGSDVEGTTLIFTVTSNPDHGTLSGTAPDLTYTPDANFHGTDSFTFVVNDGSVDSAAATVSVAVNSANDTPVADSQSVSTEQSTPIAITLTGSDVDGDGLTFAVSSDPSHGSLNGIAPDLTYTPDAGYEGVDSFSFTVSDGQATSASATVSITVNPSGPSQIFWDDFESNLGWVTDPYGTDDATTGMWERAIPEGIDYNGMKQLDETVSGSYDLVTGGDAGSSAGSYDIDSGVTSILSPEISLPEGRQLTLSFYYYLAHASNSSVDDFFRVSVIGDTSDVVFEQLGTGADVDAVWQEVSVNLSNYGGQTITILIQAADAASGSLVEAGVDDVLIMAERPNNPPTADAQSVSLQEDSSKLITLTGSDLEGDPLSYEILSQPQHGSLSGVLPNLTYTPDENFNGMDSFSFAVDDGIVSSEPATINLTINPVNDAPTAEPQNVVTQVDTTVEIVIQGLDVDGDVLNYIIGDQPDHGTLMGTLPELVYTPDSGYIGDDLFTFKVSDGEFESQTETINISVTSAGPVTVFFDDFESDQGWTFDPYGSDTANKGEWERAIAEVVTYSGYTQLEAYSGSYDLVTGYGGGVWYNAGKYDVDSGVTSVHSPLIYLPNASDITLTFIFYFAHYSNSSSEDYLRVTILGSESQVVFEELGASNTDEAVWETFTVSLNNFSGQAIYILIEAADEGGGSIVEAAIDDVLIIAD